MPEHIDRETIEYPYKTMSTWGLNSNTCKAYNEGVKAVEDYIANLPAADVVEVRHGEWLDNGDRDRNGVPKPFAISCSVCGSSAGTDWMKYCPNCGAKMDGERRKEDG